LDDVEKCCTCTRILAGLGHLKKKQQQWWKTGEAAHRELIADILLVCVGMQKITIIKLPRYFAGRSPLMGC
jgi:hypothetical protein